ncbi:MAG: glutathionylspermidine synthase family protein [Bacteroidota bacterium]|nr:glutathionylspermidine synthase family protein [Bacteroidota bacterium]
MRRISAPVRENWKKRVEDIGFGFHTINGTYWDESAYYSFTNEQIEVLESTTSELFDRCLDAVQYVIDNQLYHLFKIAPRFIPLIEKSWNEEHPSIYARFDLVYDGVHPPKMLEFNADTPTSLYEASAVQWYWLEDVEPGADQFNSIHEKLTDYWRHLKSYLNEGKLYFTCLNDNQEDLTTVEYLRDCAIQAGLDTGFIYLEDLGWNSLSNQFVDIEERPITNIFKLYPWEWLIRDEFGGNILLDRSNTLWIEPAWKMVLSNKAILPILWQLFPNHPNLLASYFDNSNLKYDYVKKPILSREGENVSIVKNGSLIASTEGNYGSEGFIFQEYCPLPQFKGNYPVIGSWVIGCEPAGIGIRETNTLITDNLSRFIPHVISKY